MSSKLPHGRIDQGPAPGFANASWLIVWLSDEAANWTFVSRDWYALTGQPNGGVGGDGWLDVVHPQDRQATQEHWVTQVQARDVVALRFRLRDRNGFDRDVLLTGDPQYDEAGLLQGYEGTLLALDRATQAHELPHQRHDYLRAICDSAADGLYVMAPDSHCTYINPAGATMLGYQASELIGRGLHDIVHHTHPDGRPHPITECPIALAAKAGKTDRIEDDVFWHKQGYSVPVAYGVSPVLINGQPAGAIVTFQDISHRKQAEAIHHQRLRAAEGERERLADLFEQSPTFACVLVGPDLVFERANQAYLDLVGRSNIVGKPLREALPEVVTQGFVSLLQGVYASGQPHVGTGVPVMLDRGGGQPEERSVDFLYQPLRDSAGRTTGIFVQGVDQTERKHLYEQLREQDRRKDEFLATLAHELRNPLAPIRTGLAVLGQAPSVEVAGQVRRIIERQVRHMVRLIDDLLDVSRISTGKVQLREERVDLREIVESSLEVSRPVIDAANHTIVVSLPTQPVWLNADRTRVAQVISNLLNNAAKYTDNGGHIELSVREQSDTAVVYVRDNGVGLAPESIGSIFELFTRAGKIRDQADGGLGVGLALARRLITLHGGSVTAQSEGLGHGSTFTIALPLAPSRDDLILDTIRVTTRTTSRSDLSILVVDDNVDAANTLALLLQLGGNTVHCEYSGRDALLAASSMGPDVILLDIGMPGMDGYEVARQLRGQVSTRSAVLIALTGWGMQSDVNHAMKQGFDHHLTKPVDAERLDELLSSIANARSLQH